MNTIAKKRVGVIFGTLAFLAFVALVVCLPRTSYAAALGTESPNVYCTYTDSNGVTILCKSNREGCKQRAVLCYR